LFYEDDELEDCLFETHFKEELQMKKLIVVFAAFALVAGFALTAAAAEWNLYGSARMATYYTDKDLGNTFGVNNVNAANEDSVSDLQWDLQANTRLGANVKGDVVSGQFEFGVNESTITSRRLYGVWHFADGWGLKVGKDYTPITFFLSGQVFDADNGLLFTGNAYGSRRGQIALEGMGFKFAAITNTTSALGSGGVVERWLPKLEASYLFKMSDAMKFHAFAGYQSYDVNIATPAGGTDDFSVDSYVVGLGAEMGFGPFFVKPQVSYYQNGDAAGWLDNTKTIGTVLNPLTGNNTVDVDTLMAMLALGFSPTENLTLEAGVGYVSAETDDIQGFDLEQTFFEYYLQAVITLAKGVYIVPEIGFRDFGDLETSGGLVPDSDLGDLFYAGAKWQINF
jgi:hypothetical protein